MSPKRPNFFFIWAKFIFKIIACGMNENIKTVAEKGERKCVCERERKTAMQTLP